MSSINSNTYQNALSAINNHDLSQYAQASGFHQRPQPFFPGGCYGPRPHFPAPSQNNNELISNIVSQFTQVLQSVVSMVSNLVSQLTGLLGGGQATAANSQSNSFFGGISDLLKGQEANPASSENKSGSGIFDMIKSFGKDILGSFFGGKSDTAGAGDKKESGSWFSNIVSSVGSWISDLF